MFLWKKKAGLSDQRDYCTCVSSVQVDTKLNSVKQNLEVTGSPETLEQTPYATICKTQEHHHLDVKSSSQEKNENIK